MHRAAFPLLREVTYLNTAAVGLGAPVQREAAAACAAAQARGSLGESAWRSVSDEAEQRLRRLLGPGPVRFHFFGNTSMALNAVAHGLSWRRGDEVLLRTGEFPSVAAAWAPAAAAGAEVREVPGTDALFGAIGPRTRLVAVSHVHYATGERVDLAALGQRCRQVGALLCVDGIQAAGTVPLDLGEVDFYCFATFKWLLGWFGLGVLACAPRGAAALRPAFRGHSPDGLQPGHVNHPGLFVLAATLRWLQDEVGMDRLHTRIAELTAHLADGLAAGGREVVTPPARAGIVSFADGNAEALVERLAATGIHVAARGGHVRVSPHFYNDEDDIDRLLVALTR